MTDEFDNCPLCGNNAKWIHVRYQKEGEYGVIGCSKCNLQINDIILKKNARKRWNARCKYYKRMDNFKPLTVLDIQKEASRYKEDFNIGLHSIWLKSGDTIIGLSETTAIVKDYEGNSVECPINELIAYILFTGQPNNIN